MKTLKFFFSNLTYLIIILLILALVIQRELLNSRCSRATRQALDKLSSSTRIIIHDSIHIDTFSSSRILPFPYPVYHDTGSFKILRIPVDTPAVFRDYFTRNVYKRTICDDSNSKILLTDTVFQNHLSPGLLETTYFPRTRIITRDIFSPQLPSRKLFLGASLSLNPAHLNIYPSLLYQSRKDHLYGISYDFPSKSPIFSIYYKLF